MPCLSSMALAPAAMLRIPSWTMAWASTVAVVVPSPATSLVLLAGFLDQLGAHVGKGIVELDVLGHGDPVMGDGGGAIFLVQGHIAALGTEGDLDGIGDGIDPLFEGLPRLRYRIAIVWP